MLSFALTRCRCNGQTALPRGSDTVPKAVSVSAAAATAATAAATTDTQVAITNASTRRITPTHSPSVEFADFTAFDVVTQLRDLVRANEDTAAHEKTTRVWRKALGIENTIFSWEHHTKQRPTMVLVDAKKKHAASGVTTRKWTARERAFMMYCRKRMPGKKRIFTFAMIAEKLNAPHIDAHAKNQSSGVAAIAAAAAAADTDATQSSALLSALPSFDRSLPMCTELEVQRQATSDLVNELMYTNLCDDYDFKWTEDANRELSALLQDDFKPPNILDRYVPKKVADNPVYVALRRDHTLRPVNGEATKQLRAYLTTYLPPYDPSEVLREIGRKMRPDRPLSIFTLLLHIPDMIAEERKAAVQSRTDENEEWGVWLATLEEIRSPYVTLPYEYAIRPGWTNEMAVLSDTPRYGGSLTREVRDWLLASDITLTDDNTRTHTLAFALAIVRNVDALHASSLRAMTQAADEQQEREQKEKDLKTKQRRAEKDAAERLLLSSSPSSSHPPSKQPRAKATRTLAPILSHKKRKWTQAERACILYYTLGAKEDFPVFRTDGSSPRDNDDKDTGPSISVKVYPTFAATAATTAAVAKASASRAAMITFPSVNLSLIERALVRDGDGGGDSDDDITVSDAMTPSGLPNKRRSAHTYEYSDIKRQMSSDRANILAYFDRITDRRRGFAWNDAADRALRHGLEQQATLSSLTEAVSVASNLAIHAITILDRIVDIAEHDASDTPPAPSSSSPSAALLSPVPQETRNKWLQFAKQQTPAGVVLRQWSV